MEENLEREKKVRADVEKAKRKVEMDLRATQENVEELERAKMVLEEASRRFDRLHSQDQSFLIKHFICNYL